jgi:diamine N-acetyltransferase
MMSASIALREISAATLDSVLALGVAPEQRRFVASNAVSIAQAHFEPGAWFRAIYADETPVGFVMLYDPTRASTSERRDSVFLWRFMIDHRHQRRGYGRAAMQRILDHARALPGISNVRLSYVPGNNATAIFYHGLGFIETGEVDEGELVMSLSL